MIRFLAVTGSVLLTSATVVLAQPSSDYVRTAGASDKFEITEAKIAEARSQNPKVRDFARMMVHDHTKSTMMIKTAATRVMGHSPAPPMLSSEQSHMIRDLRNAGRSDFDTMYVDQQLTAHQQALDLHKSYADRGDAPLLKQAAEKITPVVQEHLDHLQEIKSAMR